MSSYLFGLVEQIVDFCLATAFKTLITQETFHVNRIHSTELAYKFSLDLMVRDLLRVLFRLHSQIAVAIILADIMLAEKA